jgi:hypothetical protein
MQTLKCARSSANLNALINLYGTNVIVTVLQLRNVGANQAPFRKVPITLAYNVLIKNLGRSPRTNLHKIGTGTVPVPVKVLGVQRFGVHCTVLPANLYAIHVSEFRIRL